MEKKCMFLSRLLMSVLCCLLMIPSVLGSDVAVYAAKKQEVVRYSVLILDASSSMDGTPIVKLY